MTYQRYRAGPFWSAKKEIQLKNLDLSWNLKFLPFFFRNSVHLRGTHNRESKTRPIGLKGKPMSKITSEFQIQTNLDGVVEITCTKLDFILKFYHWSIIKEPQYLFMFFKMLDIIHVFDWVVGILKFLNCLKMKIVSLKSLNFKILKLQYCFHCVLLKKLLSIMTSVRF